MWFDYRNLKPIIPLNIVIEFPIVVKSKLVQSMLF